MTQRVPSSGRDREAIPGLRSGPLSQGYRYPGGSSIQQYDDLKIGYDNNDDGDIADAGDDIQVDDDFDSNAMSLSYDNNGNLTDDGVYQYVYDAWNRLVEVTRRPDDTTTIAEYEYLANNWRAKKVVTNCGIEETAGDGGNTTVHYYYCGVAAGPRTGRWRILETRNGSDQATRQWVYGTQYVDEPLLMDVNLEPGTDNDCNPDNETGSESSAGTNDRRYVYHQDRNWNVVALTETADGEGGTAGRVAERYAYTPYGEFVVLKGDTGSGQLANLLVTSGVGNPFAHQGLCFDQEDVSYQNRRRDRVPVLARFLQADPSGYADGLSRYGCVHNNPLAYRDRLGLQQEPPPSQPTTQPRPCPPHCFHEYVACLGRAWWVEQVCIIVGGAYCGLTTSGSDFDLCMAKVHNKCWKARIDAIDLCNDQYDACCAGAEEEPT